MAATTPKRTKRTWNPAHHPRDSKGRFTRSSTRVATAKDRRTLDATVKRFDFSGTSPTPTGTPPSEAVTRYQADGWQQVNTDLRRGHITPDAEAIDAAMQPTDVDTIVTRNVPAAMFAHIPVPDIQGMVVRDAAYASASLGESDAPGEIRLRIAVPADTMATVDPDTGNVLLARDTEMAVTKVEARPDGGYDMHLVVLPAKGAEPAQATTPAAEPQGFADPTDGVDLASLTDDDLYGMFHDLGSQQDVPDTAFQRLNDEMVRREAAEAWGIVDGLAPGKLDERQQQLDNLLADGWDYFDAFAETYGGDAYTLARSANASATVDKTGGETLDQAAKRAYTEWNDLQYLQAEQATRGHMLTAEGRAAGIDPVSLFSGNTARARKYASEDLQRWWVDNPRLTFAEFKAQTLGRQSDQAAAATTALQGNGRNFI